MRAIGLAVLFLASSPVVARADRELIVPFHESGHLVLDQLSGLRVNAAGGSYEGPIGASYRRDKIDDQTEVKTTTVWFAPSADIFVTDHLSLGGSFEWSHAWGTFGRTDTLSALPRIGFYAPVGDRFGIWPRLAVGYAKTNEIESIVVDVDLTLVYRFTESFFVRVGPDLGLTVDGSTLSMSGVAALGMNLEL